MLSVGIVQILFGQYGRLPGAATGRYLSGREYPRKPPSNSQMGRSDACVTPRSSRYEVRTEISTVITDRVTTVAPAAGVVETMCSGMTCSDFTFTIWMLSPRPESFATPVVCTCRRLDHDSSPKRSPGCD